MRRGAVDLSGFLSEPELVELEARRRKRIRFDDVGSGREERFMDLPDDVGAGQDERFVATVMTGSPEVGVGEGQFHQFRAHCAVENEDAVAKGFEVRVHPGDFPSESTFYS